MAYADRVDATPPLPRFQSIQILRTLAASLVLLIHAVDAIREGKAPVMGVFAATLPNVSAFGASGVDLFFVICGFVMAHAIANHSSGSGTFLADRWWRITPLFVLVGVAFALLHPGAIAPQSYVHLLTVLPVLDGRVYHAPALFVGWTLGFEVVFYLMAAATIRTVARGRAWVLLALTTAAAACGVVAKPEWAPAKLLINPMQLEFAFGVAAWLAWRAGATRRWGGAARLVGIALLAWGVLFGLGVPVSAHYRDAVAGTSGLARAWTWGLPWALVLVGSLREQCAGAIADGLRRLGDASYSTYLIHPAVLLLAERAGLPTMSPCAWVALVLTASWGSGVALHRLAERPLLAWAKRHRDRTPARPTASVHPACSARTVSP